MERTRASGCGKKEKGDTKGGGWCGEGKSSRAGGVRITPTLLDKLWRDAKHMKALPFMDFDFPQETEMRRPRHWVLVPAPVLQLLKDRLTEEEKERLMP